MYKTILFYISATFSTYYTWYDYTEVSTQSSNNVILNSFNSQVHHDTWHTYYTKALKRTPNPSIRTHTYTFMWKQSQPNQETVTHIPIASLPTLNCTLFELHLTWVSLHLKGSTLPSIVLPKATLNHPPFQREWKCSLPN